MPKININSAREDWPRVSVGWSRDTGHVQVATTGTAELDRDGVARLIAALRQADGDVNGRRTVSTPPPVDTISRNTDRAVAFA